MVKFENSNLERYYLHPGYIYASSKQTVVTTVLGSCVSLCLWDSRNKFGGMNHFIYPKNRNNESNGRYGNISCQYLLKLMQDLGSQKRDIVAHLVGGANSPIIKSNIGKQNIDVVEKIVSKYALNVEIRDLGGRAGRKVVFNTATGELSVSRGKSLGDGDWYK
jgi:chemotaxis protein CheD